MMHALETLVKKYAHQEYSMHVESFPTGLCQPCRQALYRCAKASKDGDEVKPKEAWSHFQLEQIKVPRLSADSTDYTCPLCRCAKFRPIGLVGEKRVVNNPIVNVDGGKLKAEIQQKVVENKGNQFCQICFQITDMEFGG